MKKLLIILLLFCSVSYGQKLTNKSTIILTSWTWNCGNEGTDKESAIKIKPFIRNRHWYVKYNGRVMSFNKAKKVWASEDVLFKIKN